MTRTAGMSRTFTYARPTVRAALCNCRDESLCLICRGLALQQLFGVTMLRLPGPALYRGGGPILFLVSAPPASAPESCMK